MNPLRALFLSLSKMPPAAMLLIVIGMAVITTMMVTGQVSEKQRQRDIENQSTSITQNGRVKQVVYSLTYIPAGSKIENKQVALQTVDELDVYDDALNSVSSVVGVVPQKAIPAHAQLRRFDLDPVLH